MCTVAIMNIEWTILANCFKISAHKYSVGRKKKKRLKRDTDPKYTFPHLITWEWAKQIPV